MQFSPRRALLAVLVLFSGCSSGPWNNPYPASEKGANIFYAAFSERPKHLDPVQSYSSNEYAFIANIYQPPLQYHYLKRPFELIPFSAVEVPRPRYFDAAGRRLPDKADPKSIAWSDYVIRIRPGIRYQPHPAFARDGEGRPMYHDLRPGSLDGVNAISDFRHTGTRELEAADYVHQIKRLAHPRLHSPLFQLMAEYIVGLRELAKDLAAAERELPPGGYLDLTRFDFPGAQVIDRHTYRIRLRGQYAQFVYWLAMPFFSPVPPEADRFYAQPGMAERNISLDWFPVGTGPYMLTVNNPNRQMVLERNPHYQGEFYPSEGESGDAEAGLLRDAGRPLPFIDKVVFSLEKEQIPYWNKFLQGYYDASGISSDSFDQAIQFSGQGDVTVSEEMQARGIQLQTSVAASIFYLGFNMIDPVVGERGDGRSRERSRKLRRAISIAIDQEEYISIFQNGRGIPAQGPLPPGIFGYREGREGINPYVYDWVDGAPRRKPIEHARRLMADAGYPGGVDPATNLPLVLNLDTTLTGVGAKSRLDWYSAQFEKLGIQLVVRTTDWNRFQDKVRKGNVQLYWLGWNADYPDPENFFFLLHGPQSKVKSSGENASNYHNAEFDRLFDRMKHMANGPERQAVIDRMLEIARADAPWVWSVIPKDYALRHAWLSNSKPNQIANNGLKYQRIDPALRDRMRLSWNEPVVWPVAVLAAALGISLVPAVRTYRRRERQVARGE